MTFYSRDIFALRSTACKGVYETFEEAQRAIPTQVHSDYDRSYEGRSIDVDIERLDQVQYEDYPVLFWLQKLIRPGIQIVDLGGSTGGTFYAFDSALGLPDDTAWLVAELPAAVSIGKRVAEARGESRINFTTELGAEHRSDVLMTMGTLQYMPRRLPEVLAGLAALPSHIIVQRVPITKGPAYWTVQNLGVTQVPYYIHNRDELVASVEAIGYQLVDSSYTLRSIRIPFHPSRDVEHYSGFMFSLSGA